MAEITKAERQKMSKLIAQMEGKIKELDKLRDEIKKDKAAKISPQKSRAMLEEIKVPALELIKD
ncbi:MAG: hypothetical protein ABH854_02370 [Candidatus Diapherotrites archaeon]|nr:hypothetical protein [Candidatus Micrarchaeota archaeon]MBU1939303.1 hypothetical protein [Candidatus Micrarchaeota archaeon]